MLGRLQKRSDLFAMDPPILVGIADPIFAVTDKHTAWKFFVLGSFHWLALLLRVDFLRLDLVVMLAVFVLYLSCGGASSPELTARVTHFELTPIRSATQSFQLIRGFSLCHSTYSALACSSLRCRFARQLRLVASIAAMMLPQRRGRGQHF